MSDASTQDTVSSEQSIIAQLTHDNATLTKKLAEAEAAHARLQEAYTRALEQLQVLRRRLFVAKAERANVDAAQLAFDSMFEQVKALESALQPGDSKAGNAADGKGDKPAAKKPPPKGRRDLAESDLPLVRVEIADPNLEGKAERIGVETTWRLGFERGGLRRISTQHHSFQYRAAADGGRLLIALPAWLLGSGRLQRADRSRRPASNRCHFRGRSRAH